MFTQQCQRSSFVNWFEDSHAIRFRCKNQTNTKLLLSIRKYCNKSRTKARLFRRSRHFIFAFHFYLIKIAQCNIRAPTLSTRIVSDFFFHIFTAFARHLCLFSFSELFPRSFSVRLLPKYEWNCGQSSLFPVVLILKILINQIRFYPKYNGIISRSIWRFVQNGAEWKMRGTLLWIVKFLLIDRKLIAVTSGKFLEEFPFGQNE